MPDELKAMLKKVLATAGKKKFFFAYGLGKRKDGKGDGELAVNIAKPKKEEIEEELAECTDVYEGVCWAGAGVADGATVYYQGKGKKLSKAIVDKMVKTAKKITNLQYDFQMPTPAEETRGESLAAEGDKAKAIPPAPLPSKPGTPAPKAETAPTDPDAARFAERLKAAALVMQKAAATGSPHVAAAKLKISEANAAFRKKDYAGANDGLDEAEELLKQALTPPGTAAPQGTEGAARFSSRLKLLAPVMSKALDSGHALAEQAKGKIAEANTAFRAKDYTQANALLDQAEALMKQALKASTPPTADTNLQAEWERRVTDLEPRVLDAQTKRAGEAKWMTLFMSGQDLGSAGDFAKALAVLKKLEGLLNAPPREGAPDGAGALQAWATARAGAVGQLAKLLAAFKTSGHPESDRGMVLVKAIIKNLTPRPAAPAQVAELVRYLETDDIIPAVEKPNPFGFAVSIRTPLLKVLGELKKHVA